MKERLHELLRATSGGPAARSLAREFLQAAILAALHAILQRPYPKGRDFYDLIWYLSDREWPAPNLVLLNNALARTGWEGAPLSPTSWATAIRERLRSVRWEALAADVRPLLESAEDRALLTRETVTSLLDERTARKSR